MASDNIKHSNLFRSVPKRKREFFKEWSSYIVQQLGHDISISEVWIIYMIQECRYSWRDIVWRSRGKLTIHDIRATVNKYPYLKDYYVVTKQHSKDALDRDCLEYSESPRRHEDMEV